MLENVGLRNKIYQIYESMLVFVGKRLINFRENGEMGIRKGEKYKEECLVGDGRF